MRLKTVAIDRDGVKVLINESDFDPDQHQRWGEEQLSEKDRLAVELESLGVEFDKRAGVAKLRKLLSEAR